ncbi:MAG: PTS sugar transporter subunit IIA [Lachnospiraceae bacterium]|nr:PTS sugar transporter subunit IIA [Lachnospiraceae bacterium]
MIWEDLNEKLIIPKLEVKNSSDVFQKLGGLLVSEGYCKNTYVQALIDREKEFPTGINMGEIGIAIPHTDRGHVNKGAVAIGILKEPVHFYQMGFTDVEVNVKIVFMLAVDDPEAHLPFLQRVLQVLQDQNVLEKLTHVTKSQEIIEIVKEKEQELELIAL